MEEQKRRKTERCISGLSLAVLACALLYILYTALVKKAVDTMYYVVLFGCLALYWLLTDVLSVVLAKRFEGKTEEQKKAYRTFAVLDLIGLGGLGYFAFTIGNNGGIIGAVIYVVTLTMKRKYQDEYRGVAREEAADDAESEAAGPESANELPEEDEKEAPARIEGRLPEAAGLESADEKEAPARIEGQLPEAVGEEKAEEETSGEDA